MLAKGNLPSPKISDADSDICFSSIASPHVAKLSDNYQYSGNDKARCIRETLNCSMLSLLLLLFFLSVAAYAVILGLRYIVTTTDYYGEEENCLQSQIAFNGWSFKYFCMLCAEGFAHGHDGSCVEYEH